MDPKKDPPKRDILAELDLPALFQQRTDAAKKQKEATDKVNSAQASHLLWFWVGGCLMAFAAVVVTQTFPEDDPTGIVLLSTFIIFGLGMWIVAFFPKLTVRKRQDEATAATKSVKDIETKIAFCNVVLEEAKSVKLRKYAEAWVEKELSSPPKT
jgi:hypothetical protein